MRNRSEQMASEEPPGGNDREDFRPSSIGRTRSGLREPPGPHTSLSAKISLRSRCRLQHFQRRTPPHFRFNASHIPRRCDEHVARDSHGCLTFLELHAHRAPSSPTCPLDAFQKKGDKQAVLDIGEDHGVGVELVCKIVDPGIA